MRSVAAFALVVSLLAAGPAAAASRADPPGRMKAVVRAWSARLNAGDNRGIAALFRLPAVVIQGQYAYRLTTPRQVEIWHAALPCSGRIVSITVRGRFATAVFRLGDRPTSKCDAPGSLAAARVGIVRGKIVSWEQVPVDSARGPVA